MAKQKDSAFVPNVEPIMEDAFGFIEADVKKEYLQALEAVPHLVATETPKSKFLRVEGNDPWKAARRLAMYWKFRKAVLQSACGGGKVDDVDEDRWLRPMTTSGRAFLTELDVHILRQGIYSYHYSRENGPILVVNGARNKGATPEICHRIIFYFATIIEEEALQTEGITILYAVSSDDTESNIDAGMGIYAALGLPVKVRQYIVVQNYEIGKESILEYLSFRRKLQVTHNYKGNCDLISSTHSRQHLLTQVNEAGVPWHILPKSCGGRLDDAVLCQWLRQRLTLEDAMGAASPSVVISTPFAFNNPQQQQFALQHVASQQVEQQQQGPEQAIISVGKRRRFGTGRSSDTEPWIDVAFDRKLKRMRASNDALREDNRHLEEMLVQARRIVFDHQFNMTTMTRPAKASMSSTSCMTLEPTMSLALSQRRGQQSPISSSRRPRRPRNETMDLLASLPVMSPEHQQLQQKQQQQHHHEQQQPFAFSCPGEQHQTLDFSAPLPALSFAPPHYQQQQQQQAQQQAQQYHFAAASFCLEPRHFQDNNNNNINHNDNDDDDVNFGSPVEDPLQGASSSPFNYPFH